MKKPKNIDKSISIALAKWDKEQTLSEFVKDELMQIDPKTNKPLRSTVVKRLVYLTEHAITDGDQIKAADVLFKTIAAGEAKVNESTSPATLNFFQLASERINESVKQLIDVTPKGKAKRGIEQII